MENIHKTLIDEETKSICSTSAYWMKVYSVLVLSMNLICFIGFIFFLFNIEFIFGLFGIAVPDARILEMMKGFILLGLVFTSLSGYAMMKLFISGNKFSNVSYSVKSMDVVHAFQNLKIYWKFTGITYVILLIVVFFVGFKMLPLL
jgi:hypothetical protein